MIMQKNKSGFTLVELLIVIVVIAILAAISIVAYNGIQTRTRETVLKTDLSNAAKQMELANADTGSYPSALPNNVTPSQDIVLSLSQTSTGYCINGEYKNNTSIRWRYESTSGGLQQGLCSGAVISGSEAGTNPNLILNTDFSSGWNLNLQSSAGRSLSVRNGTANDPYPNRPVLQLNNNGTTATRWAVLQDNKINRSEIKQGQTYYRAFYVRKIGPYSGSLTIFGIMDDSGQNPAIYSANGPAVTDSWQYVSGTVTAVNDSTSNNQLYLNHNNGAYTTSGWTLEFQGFELRKQ